MTHAELIICFLGDIVGADGRRAAIKAAMRVREQYAHAAVRPIVIANAENSKNGSGLSPDNLGELSRGGGGDKYGIGGAIDAFTLGDHCFKDRAILGPLSDEAVPLSRPANLAAAAPGKRKVRIDIQGFDTPRALYVITVLGRIYMPMPADNPFAAVDREIESIPEKDALVVIEVHAEVTSEKQAMAWHCLHKWTRPNAGRPTVVGVVGTHTHVQTADARILEHRLAAITDLGMCGPHRSVIGRDVTDTLMAMTEQAPVALSVASDDVRAKGAAIRVNIHERRAVGIELLDIPCGE